MNDHEYELSFYYDPSGRSIRFKNQRQIEWKKTKRDEYWPIVQPESYF
jgi:hypothetical protein